MAVVKLLDFDRWPKRHSQVVGRASQTQSSLTAFASLWAPEQWLLALRQTGPRTDVWGLAPRSSGDG
jgi:hypothetical protein